MEPHREEQQRALEPSAERNPKRFRIVKLEERIAPGQGGTNKCVTGECLSGACGGTVQEACSAMRCY